MSLKQYKYINGSSGREELCKWQKYPDSGGREELRRRQKYPDSGGREELRRRQKYPDDWQEDLRRRAADSQTHISRHSDSQERGCLFIQI